MLKYTKTVLVMLALLLAVLGPLLVAAQEDGDDDPIPPPTGPYQVGQTYRHWVDESRDEPYTDEEDDHRELVVMIWYPADVADDMERAQYWESLSDLGEDTWATYFESGQLASLTPFSQEVFDSFPELKTHAVRDAPVAETESTYPVLIFSHGGEGWPELYTYQALELASHGYIVIGINHTFYSSLTVFPDGHVTGFIGFNGARHNLRN
jgi:hypothetical protein